MEKYTQKHIYKQGCDAYMAGKKIEDNPFIEEIDPDYWEYWDFAYKKEKDYWESL